MVSYGFCEIVHCFDADQIQTLERVQKLSVLFELFLIERYIELFSKISRDVDSIGTFFAACLGSVIATFGKRSDRIRSRNLRAV
jgi:hypothetical protein